MKIIISESQYHRILSEQPEGVMDRRVGIENTNMKALGYNPSNYLDVQKYKSDVYGKGFTGHEVATILQIGTAFIPVIGPFISSGIGFLEAKSYWDEGNERDAILVAIFSSLPFIGSIVSKIPGVKQLGQKGMILLANKISSGAKNLNKAEIEVSTAIAKYSPEIREELLKISPKLKGIIKDIEKYKSNFVKKYGQEKYDDLIVDYLYDGIDKKTFIQRLSEVKNPNIRIKPIMGGGADHRVFQSTTNPNVVFKTELRPGEVDKWYNTFKKYPDFFAKTFKKTQVKDVDGTILKAVAIEKLNTKPFMELWNNIENILQGSQSSLPYKNQINSLETLLKNINKYPRYKDTWNNLIKLVEKKSPQIIDKVKEFSKVVDKFYEITSTPDIRKFNLGYDNTGVLKVLDL